MTGFRLGLALLLAGAALGGAAGRDPAAPFAHTFDLPGPGEAVATITARCDGCAWDVAGREAVTLRLSLDGRYVAHLPLVRRGRGEYQVMLGAAGAGRHTVSAAVDAELTATALRHAGAATVERMHVQPVLPGEAGHLPLSLAPILHARPDTVGRFSDVPVFMWYEREPAARGVRYRYSVVFTNEDGGTPADRLMATWGRTTDIEYVYSVELDEAGTILADDMQGPDHEVLPFAGAREGRHPLLWVSTDNNMVLDRGATRVRYAPAPVAFPLDGVSREAVMDANPWLYAVAAQELLREGKIAADAPPGRGAVPDPRTFVYVEACGEVGPAALAMEVRAGDGWKRSDRGVADYTIVRDGCFRAAVPVREGTKPSAIRALRITARQRPPRDGRPAPPARTVRIDRINTVFMLDEHHRPGPPLIRWTGPAVIEVGGPPLEVGRGEPRHVPGSASIATWDSGTETLPPGSCVGCGLDMR